MGRRAKSEFEVHKATVPNGNLKWYIVGRPNKVRQRAWFATKEKAEAEATERNTTMKRLGEDSATVDNALIAMALEGATALAPYGKTLRDAVSFYLSHLARLSVSVPVSDFVGRVRSEFERRREAGESSVRHHTSMLETLKKFEEHFADRQLATLTASEITAWLTTLKLAIKTRNRHLGYLRNAFGLAEVKFKVLSANPLEKVGFFHDPANLFAILSPLVRPEGPIKPAKKLSHAMKNARLAAGINPWRQNCIRHSFCSYAVALKGLDWTAMQADHSTRMLREHYLEVVTKEDSERYWAIRL